jgi:hypothetical protein
VSVQIADEEKREHVERSDRHEDSEGIEGRREHHREEEQEREGAARAPVGGDCDRDQGDVEHAPGREERVPDRRVPQDALDREQHDQHATDDADGEQSRDQRAVALLPGDSAIEHAGGTDRKSQPDARLDHLLLQLLFGGIDDP